MKKIKKPEVFPSVSSAHFYLVVSVDRSMRKKFVRISSANATEVARLYGGKFDAQSLHSLGQVLDHAYEIGQKNFAGALRNLLGVR